jgi:hypothetical protein
MQHAKAKKILGKAATPADILKQIKIATLQQNRSQPKCYPMEERGH